MPRIGLISDTHGFLHPNVLKHFSDCDQIWHAGDFGTIEVSDALSAFKPLRGVYGNIDGGKLRLTHPLEQTFECGGFKIYMVHIGGKPGKYPAEVKKKILSYQPDIFVCGHSHILRIVTDAVFHNMLHINPGAAGKEGFHHVMTLVKFDLNDKKISEVKVIELGKRGKG